MHSEELIKELRQGLLKWYDFKPHGTFLYIGDKTDACAALLHEITNQPAQISSEEAARILTAPNPTSSAKRAQPSTAFPSSLTSESAVRSATRLTSESAAQSATRLTCAPAAQTASPQWQQIHAGSFDYIIAIETLEHQPNPAEYLRHWKSLLKPDGTLLLGMNNRFGLRYFCGDRDPYTDRNFDGIEGYRRAYSKKEDTFRGRCYSRAELRDMLRDSGFGHVQFFSVLTDLNNPSFLYAEDCLPNEDLSNRLFPTYNYPDTVFLEEESLYNGLIENGMFHEMANAYLIECPLSGKLSDVSHVTSSMSRGPKRALLTIIHKSGIVEKRAAHREGKSCLEKLITHSQELSARGIPAVEARLENDSYIMPYINAEVGQLYLKKLLRKDMDTFLRKMDEFRDLILRSSEIVRPDQGDGEGVILQKGYIDMVPLNSFYVNGSYPNDSYINGSYPNNSYVNSIYLNNNYVNGSYPNGNYLNDTCINNIFVNDTFVFFDQEFCEENYPANALIWRMVATFYAGDMEVQKLLPMDVLLERYDLKRKLEKWQKMEWDFLAELRQEKTLRKYYETCRRNYDIVNSNRQRLNYSSEKYQKLFIDIFRNADTRKLILFGSGNFTKRFLGLYRQDYPVYAIIDNNQEKWGQEMDGIAIRPPEILNELQSGEYKVLICIKNYLSVMKQLDSMGVTEYSIFDSGKDYPRKRKPLVPQNADAGADSVGAGFAGASSAGAGSARLGLSGAAAVKKKYHVGYIAGVFDLFHVGHLNMFKRAKEQCDYLIVGVVTDEGVRKFKETETFVPYEERVEIVRACRYVDEVVEIPLNFGGTSDAWRMHHFDCQFSGSDYINNPDWLAEKEFLKKHGAEMEFFPYTQSTSSSKIKALIEKKLM